MEFLIYADLHNLKEIRYLIDYLMNFYLKYSKHLRLLCNLESFSPERGFTQRKVWILWKWTLKRRMWINDRKSKNRRF